MFIVKKKNVKYSAKIKNFFLIFFSKFLRISKSISEKNKFLKIPFNFFRTNCRIQNTLIQAISKNLLFSGFTKCINQNY